MVNVSSDLIMERSCVSAAAAAAESSFSGTSGVVEVAAGSAVVPLVPAVGEPGAGRVAAEEDDEQLVKEGVVVAEGEVLDDAFKHDDPADGLENEPEIRQRLRTFHIV